MSDPIQDKLDDALLDLLLSAKEAGRRLDTNAVLLRVKETLEDYQCIGTELSVLDETPIISGYDVIRKISSTNVRSIYEAIRQSTGERVALKVLPPPPYVSNNEIQRLRLEFDCLRSLIGDSATLPVFDFSQDSISNRHFYSMKLMKCSLKERLSDYCADPKQVATLLISIAGAVAAAHKKDILHRDLKPGNVLLDEFGQPYLCDFGHAKDMKSGAEQLTGSREIVGTMAYMSPEQARAEKLTFASDVYGLGAILYAMLTERPPFDAGDDWSELRYNVCNVSPVPPTQLKGCTLGDLETICLTCLRKAPQDRYPTASALIHDLQNYILSKPINQVASRSRLATAGPGAPFRVGSVELPITRLVGGDGHVRYSFPDGIICAPSATTFVLPDEVEEVKENWLAAKLESARARNAVFENRPSVRIDDYRPGLSLIHDRPWPLHLSISHTDFFQAQLTNGCMNEKLAGGECLRARFPEEPEDLRNSKLANPMVTNLSLVTSDHVIYVARRSEKVATNPGGLAPAVSGTANPILDIIDPKTAEYSPFRQAQREAFEEATAPYTADLSEITFFGLGRRLDNYYPFLFGELRIKLSSIAFESQLPGDSWETRGLIAIPFNVAAVTDWIKEEYAKLVSRETPSGGIETAIFSLLQSLAYEFTNEWQDVIRRLTLY